MYDSEIVFKKMEEAIKTGKGRPELARQPDVVEFLEKEPLGGAQNWGKEIDNWEVWKVILGRPDVDTLEAIRFAIKYHCTAVYQIIFSRPDVLNFLQKDSLEKVIFYAQLVGNWVVWKIVLARPDLPIQRAKDLAVAFAQTVNHYNHEEVMEVVRNRKDYEPDG